MTTMERILKFLGLLCFYSYIFLLVTWGLLGFVDPGYELTKSYQIKLDGLDQQGLNSLFDHIRFLKAFVLGIAAFGITFRRQIFEVRAYNRILQGTLFLCASGRLLTMLVNGRPCSAQIGFMYTEYFFFICIFAYARNTLGGQHPGQYGPS